ncbi:MAG: 5'-methylthioadenosine/adenosylhomocysteine nucleosidase [Rhodospirillales bacterium]|nr:5'-methylthioadenosine/adenosylhomocysteine nucleosidase [Rhodospirillales bacterium]
MRIAIMSAMSEEIDMLLQELGPDAEMHSRGMRDYYVGELAGHEVVLVFSRWGKVAAAATATHLITEFGVKRLLFSGAAGALAPDLKVGDIVVGTELLQHDIDARPLFKEFETPLLGLSRFPADPDLRRLLTRSAIDFVKEDLESSVPASVRARFGLEAPSIRQGVIVSGDRFISSHADSQSLRDRIPDALCVEMEGAAVAQTCFEYGVDFAIMRVISDSADDTAHIDFVTFIDEVARNYAHGVMLRALAEL